MTKLYFKIFTTPENKHFAFNLPDYQTVHCSEGGFYIPEKLKTLNKHIDFNYLDHDLEHRGINTNDLLAFNITHLQSPLKQKSDNWQDTADKWLFEVKGLNFEFFTGCGHRVAASGFGCKQGFNDFKNKHLTQYGFERFIKEFSKPKTPKPTDLLYSLLSDSEACQESFNNWCSNFGYDQDSIRALNIYRACQENGEKLKKLGLNLDQLREALQDY